MTYNMIKTHLGDDMIPEDASVDICIHATAIGAIVWTF